VGAKGIIAEREQSKRMAVILNRGHHLSTPGPVKG